jgi:hypothetical protein
VNGQYQRLRFGKLVRIDRLLNQPLFHLVENAILLEADKVVVKQFEVGQLH